jgi:aminomethyltransferase
MSDERAALALQGPTSYAVLKNLGLDGIETARRFDIQYFPFHGETLMVSRTGFTGDLGYELWIPRALALTLWDELYAAGADYGIHPFGETATNMARLEAAFIMPAMEFNEALRTVHFEHDQTPFELNLGWLVDFKKPHFSGRRALLREQQTGSKYTLSKLDIEGNKPAEGSYIYKNKRCTQEIGYVTSAMWSPAVKANIALAMIETKYLQGDLWAEIYFEKELRQYSRVARCTLKQKPFWAPARASATPPPDY